MKNISKQIGIFEPDVPVRSTRGSNIPTMLTTTRRVIRTGHSTSKNRFNKTFHITAG